MELNKMFKWKIMLQGVEFTIAITKSEFLYKQDVWRNPQKTLELATI